MSFLEQQLIERLTLDILLSKEKRDRGDGLQAALPESYSNAKEYRLQFHPLLYQESICYLQCQCQPPPASFLMATDPVRGDSNTVDASTPNNKVRNNDVVVLSKTQEFPNGFSPYLIAIVTSKYDADCESNGPCRLKLKLVDSTRENLEAPIEWTAFPIGSIMTFNRISVAIYSESGPRMLVSILDPFNLPPPNEEVLSRSSIAHQLSSCLNRSQKSAVLEALSLNQSGVSIIQGPPGISEIIIGTGKTRTLGVIVTSLLERGHSVMYAAPTNHALKAGARQLLSIFKSHLIPFASVADVLLIGNEENLNVEFDPECRQLFLDYRVKRIKESTSNYIQIYLKLKAFVGCSSDLDVNFIFGDDFGWDRYVEIFEDLTNQFKTCIRDLNEIWSTMLPQAFNVGADSIPVESFQKVLDSIEAHLKNFKLFLMPYSANENLFRKVLTNFNFLESPTKYLDDFFRSNSKTIHKNLLCCSNFHIECSKIVSIQEFNFQKVLLASSLVTFSTVSIIGRKFFSHFIKNKPVVVVDEAAQLIEAESLIILQYPQIRHLVLVGDENQLRATVFSVACRRGGYDRSLFERLKFNGFPTVLLNEQYRMHTQISLWPSQYVYDGKLLNSSVVSERPDSFWHVHPTFAPCKMFDLPGSVEKSCPVSGSTFNELEASVIVSILTRFSKEFTFSEDISIGVITFYKAQKALIEEKLLRKGILSMGNIRLARHLVISVNTVDSFQGQERDIIIISTVRSNLCHKIGFTNDMRRLNVALTRARHSLWVVINSETFSQDTTWHSLIEHCKTSCYFQIATKDKGVQKLVATDCAISQLTAPNKKRIILNDCVWAITFTKQAKTSIEKLERHLVLQLVEKILLIASGSIKKSKENNDPSETPGIQIKQFKVGNFIILWSIELESYPQYYQQVIHLWDVCESGSAASITTNIQHILRSRTEEYLEACGVRTNAVSNGTSRIIKPSQFLKPQHKIAFYRKKEDEIQLNDIIEGDSDLTNLVKTFHLSNNVISLMQDDIFSKMELPFSLGDDEQKLVNHKASLFILGRSGTGKTTVMLTRMLVKELAIHQSGIQDFSGSKSKQLLITCNSRLCAASSQYYSKLRMTYPELKSQANPEFYSFEDMLMNINRAAKTSFFLQERCDQTSVDSDFIFKNVVDADAFELSISGGSQIGRYRKQNQVMFLQFSNLYFPRFSESVKKSYSASILWMEIQSFIKGSTQSIASPNGHMSREDYVKVSGRLSILNKNDREIIYSTWREYEKLKVYKSQWDIADLTTFLYKQLESGDFKLDPVDFVYLDEVQDLTQMQIALFRYVCRNNDGFCFGGDTAQTIASGVGFRFQDVRALFYERFLNHNNQQLADVHCLTQNFRTHSGILKLSGSVLGLLFRLFPNAVDKIPAENGALYAGGRPILISRRHGDLTKNLFEKKENSVDLAGIELGANQCIIVRNQKSKEDLQKVIPFALILTILESKGMEFEDVLIFNFFFDSLFTRWHIVSGMNADDDYHGFDEKRDHELCSELKSIIKITIVLYVAVTRSKCRLFIVDDSEPRNPLLVLWESQSLVAISSELHFAKSSTSEEWDTRGEGFFANNQFGEAIFCYTRSGNAVELRRSMAMKDMNQADKLRSEKKLSAANELYIQAADAFEFINLNLQAAECHLKAGSHKPAAHLYFKEGHLLKALNVCLNAKKLQTLALHFFARKPSEADQTQVEKYARFFALLSLRLEKKEELMSFLGYVNTNGARSFLKRYKEVELLFEFDKKNRNWKHAAESAELKGLFKDTFEYHINDSNVHRALEISIRYFLNPRLLLLAFKPFVDGVKDTRKTSFAFSDKAYEKDFNYVLDETRKIMPGNKEKLSETVRLVICLIDSNIDELSGFAPIKGHEHLNLLASFAIFINNVESFKVSAAMMDLPTVFSKINLLITEATKMVKLILHCISTLNCLSSFSRDMSGFSGLFPIVFGEDNMHHLPKAFASDLSMSASNKLTWNMFSAKINKGLFNMEDCIVARLFETAKCILDKLQVCPEISLLAPEKKCTCTSIHDPEMARKCSKLELSLRMRLIDFLQLCHERPGTRSLESDNSQKLIRALFPTSFQFVDARSLGKFMKLPSLQFGIEIYILRKLQDQAINMESSLRMWILRFITNAPILGPKMEPSEPLYEIEQSCRWNKTLSFNNQSFALKSYVQDGISFINKSFDGLLSQQLNPLLFMDVLDQYTPAIIGLFTKFEAAYLPPSLILKLSYCKITSMKAWTQKFTLDFEFGLLLEKLLVYFQKSLSGWFKPSKMNSHDISLVMIRFLRIVFVFYINMPNERRSIEQDFLKSGLREIIELYNLKGLDHFHQIKIESSSKAKPKVKKAPQKNREKRLRIAMIEWMDKINDPVYALTRTKRESFAPRINVSKADPLHRNNFNLCLEDFFNSKQINGDVNEDAEEQEDSLLEESDTLIAPEHTMQEVENVLISDFYRRKLFSIADRIRKKIEMRNRTDLSSTKRLEIEAEFEFRHRHSLKKFYSSMIIPHVSRLNAEIAILADCIKKAMNPALLRYVAGDYGIEEITETLYSRYELIADEVQRISPSSCIRWYDSIEVGQELELEMKKWMKLIIVADASTDRLAEAIGRKS